MSLGRIAFHRYSVTKSIVSTIFTYTVVFAALIYAFSLQAAAEPVTDGMDIAVLNPTVKLTSTWGRIKIPE